MEVNDQRALLARELTASINRVELALQHVLVTCEALEWDDARNKFNHVDNQLAIGVRMVEKHIKGESLTVAPPTVAFDASIYDEGDDDRYIEEHMPVRQSSFVPRTTATRTRDNVRVEPVMLTWQGTTCNRAACQNVIHWVERYDRRSSGRICLDREPVTKPERGGRYWVVNDVGIGYELWMTDAVDAIKEGLPVYQSHWDTCADPPHRS